LGSTVNRLCRSLKATLNHAAKLDDRITNSKAWGVGLAALSEADTRETNVVLTGTQVRAVVAAAYDISLAFGLYVEAHAVSGARSSQIARLDVADLQLGAAPKLLMPSSLKGRGRTVRTRKPVPIPAGLAKRLKQAADGRASDAPLLLRPDGERWRDGEHFRPFARAAADAGLPAGTTIYGLRHTAITMALLSGAPIRLVASSFDTSTAMIEKTYSKFITDHGDAVMRRGLFDADAPGGDNVVPLRKG
jgi:integrase